MIDTLIINLPENRFRILDHDRFSPSSSGLFRSPYLIMGSRGYISCFQNPTPAEMRDGLYKPRLTLTKRARGNGVFPISLKIEFSAPKLLFGNNFDELTDTDLASIVAKLVEVLRTMGVIVLPEDIFRSDVSGIHYSKNIPLTDHSTCSMIINELNQAEAPRRWDVNQANYRNGGIAYKYHTNSFEFIVYDKISDLRQAQVSERRAIESDNYPQLSLFDGIETVRPFEVIRLELRPRTKEKIRHILSQTGLDLPLSLQNLFSSSVSKAVLSMFWGRLEESLSRCVFGQQEPIELLEDLVRLNPDTQIGKLMRAHSALLSQQPSQRRFRLLFDHAVSTRESWYGLSKILKRLTLPEPTGFLAYKNVSRGLEDFQPLRLVDYEI